MTQIIYRTDEDSFVVKISGHAGYAEKGSDIVCASISSLAQTLALSIMDTTDKVDYNVEIDKDHGMMLISAKGRKALDAFEVVLKGFEQTAFAFPENVSISKLNGGV